ncbi:hypothetical protein RS3R6_26890 [Pseudomonas atacamensis]|nr:hypothetical protein RS3R6_26890 [Pseudomonas atacamensis]
MNCWSTARWTISIHPQRRLNIEQGGSTMARYIPITGIDCKIPCVLIDSEAPIDVLHGTAA